MNYLEEVAFFSKKIQNGEVLLSPTDTILGLACDSNNNNAYQKIFTLKNRPSEKKLILLASSIEMIKKYVVIPPKIETLLAHHKRPLTVIYEKIITGTLPTYCASKDNSIAIRLVQNIFLQDVINEIGHPLASTSANLSGEPSPLTIEDVSPSILNSVEIFDKSELFTPTNKASVIARVDENQKELIFVRE